jgi:hypothetical protein
MRREPIVSTRTLYLQGFYGGGGNRTRVACEREQAFVQGFFSRAAAQQEQLFGGTETGLYVIEVPDGPFKIGVANDALDRIKTLQQGNPAHLHLVCVMPGTTALEKFVHAELAAWRLASEWFDSSDPVMAVVEELVSIAEVCTDIYASMGHVDCLYVADIMADRAGWEVAA